MRFVIAQTTPTNTTKSTIKMIQIDDPIELLVASLAVSSAKITANWAAKTASAENKVMLHPLEFCNRFEDYDPILAQISEG